MQARTRTRTCALGALGAPRGGGGGRVRLIPCTMMIKFGAENVQKKMSSCICKMWIHEHMHDIEKVHDCLELFL